MATEAQQLTFGHFGIQLVFGHAGHPLSNSEGFGGRIDMVEFEPVIGAAFRTAPTE
jgi:hypothetical protein